MFLNKYDINKDIDIDVNVNVNFNVNFNLHNFQKYAIDGIINNRNVLVCVGTGSGKTLIAKYAIAH